jgi:hypothetical protein
MRRFASGGVNPGFFAHALMDSSQNASEGIADIIAQIFLPLSRELRRYLMHEVERPGALNLTVEPSTDRAEEDADCARAHPPHFGKSLHCQQPVEPIPMFTTLKTETLRCHCQ